MNKKRKQDNWQPGPQGMFYSQKVCPACQKLIVGRSPKSYRGADSNLGTKLKAHREECQNKQIKLGLPGGERKQAGTIKRISIRGEVK